MNLFKSTRSRSTNRKQHTFENGVKFLYDPSEKFDVALCNGGYDKVFNRLCKTFIKDGDCLDVGAQRGLNSIEMSKHIGKDCRVIAIEADPFSVQELLANIDLNKSTNIYPLMAAISDDTGFTNFFLSRQLGWSSRFPNELAESTKLTPLHITTVTIDAILEYLNVKRIDVMKLDIEGSEVLALKGANLLLTHHRPVIYFEVNTGSLKKGGSSASELVDLLRSYNYSTFTHYSEFSNDQLELVTKKLDDVSVLDCIGIPNSLGFNEQQIKKLYGLR